jgi:hypothetical protein
VQHKATTALMLISDPHSRHSSVSTVTRLRAGLETQVRFLAGDRESFLHHLILPDTWAHPVSYPVGIRSKAAGACSSPLARI